jgi:CDP-4-dehydro-6-deoxyglucose reductase
VPQIKNSHGLEFEAQAGESILDAALRAGVSLPYSCRTGRCSTCKCRIESGDTYALHPETGLTPAELADGWVLSCVRSALGDTVLDVEDLGGVQLAPPRTQPCRVASLDRLSPDVVQVVLRLPPTVTFAYEPGQYIDVIGPGGIRRSYSIANAQVPGRTIDLHIREVEGGAMSAYWFDSAKPNDLLRLHGPLGTFFLRDVTDVDLVFLATGTGIAPIKAMLESLPGRTGGMPRSIRVFWGARRKADIYWQPPVGVADIPIDFVPVLSREDADWPGARGHVQDIFLASAGAMELSRCRVYACGSDTMIHAARHRLIEAGVNERHFLSDAFVCSAAA